MKTVKTIVLLVLLFASAAHAQIVLQRHWSFSSTLTIQGQKYSQLLSSFDHPDYPAWNFEAEPCPLPATNAVNLARTALLEVLGSGSEPVLKSYTLNKMYENIWFYEVSFTFPGPAAGENTRCSILVGLDGSVPPLKSKIPETSAEIPDRVTGPKFDTPTSPVLLTPEQDQRLVDEGKLPPPP